MGKRPPDPPKPVFFVDECIAGRSLTERLIGDGYTVETHTTAGIARGTPDAEWIPVVAAKRWVILSKDKFDNENEREVITTVEATAFVLRHKKARSAEIIEIFAGAMPKICRSCAKRTRPLLGFISPSGAITYPMRPPVLLRPLCYDPLVVAGEQPRLGRRGGDEPDRPGVRIAKKTQRMSSTGTSLDTSRAIAKISDHGEADAAVSASNN